VPRFLRFSISWRNGDLVRKHDFSAEYCAHPRETGISTKTDVLQRESPLEFKLTERRPGQSRAPSTSRLARIQFSRSIHLQPYRGRFIPKVGYQP